MEKTKRKKERSSTSLTINTIDTISQVISQIYTSKGNPSGVQVLEKAKKHLCMDVEEEGGLFNIVTILISHAYTSKRWTCNYTREDYTRAFRSAQY